jgi:hypothetical protein
MTTIEVGLKQMTSNKTEIVVICKYEGLKILKKKKRVKIILGNYPENNFYFIFSHNPLFSEATTLK